MSMTSNFIDKYFFTALFTIHFVLASFPMTDFFSKNIGIYTFMSFMIILSTWFLEQLANKKMSIKEKAIKVAPVMLLNALLIFVVCTLFVFK
ncbi:hypothetical protein [Salinicoccus albus]|uniref:hypothetical protein n=1 Tax=Salinicoccus albus TaxID=418756 RepID=UPI0003738BE1|nr:hypothetical protein [Salinicoccus albus]